MKLKYYLRGIGIGIVGTTILFMVLMSFHKNDVEPDRSVLDTESKTVEEHEKNLTEKDPIEARLPKENSFPAQPEEETENNADTQSEDLLMKDREDDTEQEGARPTEPDEAAKPSNQPEKKPESPSKQPEEGTDGPSGQTSEPVHFEVKGGEYSDIVCRKLKEAGLIDDAASFNAFLVKKDYDNAILPGIYDIPKGATYEQIAAILTNK